MLHFSLIPLKVNLFKRDLLKSIFPVCWTVGRKTGYFPTLAKQSSYYEWNKMKEEQATIEFLNTLKEKAIHKVSK